MIGRFFIRTATALRSRTRTIPASSRPRLSATPVRSLRLSPRQRTSGLASVMDVRKPAESALPLEEEKTANYTRLPKVELHIHMDGAGRLDTLRELSRQHGLDYPHDDAEAFKKLVMLLSPASSLSQFLRVFTVLRNILSTKEAVERVVYEYCEDLKRQNVVYFELRYTPMCHKMEPEEFIEGVIAGLERGERDFGVKSRQILVLMRDKPEFVPRIVELAVKYRSRGVVGVDMAGDELLPLDPRHVQGFIDAKANGLHVTVHAGESGPAANVRQAIEELGAERIGHGYHVLDDETIYQLARDKKIHFEACPTSSVFTNCQTLDSHAIKQWALDGISFSLNTDDPGVIGNDLITEYNVASQQLGLDRTQIVQSVLNGVGAAFLPDDEKAQLLGSIKEAIAQWERESQPDNS